MEVQATTLTIIDQYPGEATTIAIIDQYPGEATSLFGL
jgi:hypothetical protein